MLTPAKRALSRITTATTDDGRAIVVTIGPGDVLTFRAKGRRVAHTIAVGAAMAHAARFAARDAKRARNTKRRAAKQTTPEKKPGTRPTVTTNAHPVAATSPTLPAQVVASVPPRVASASPKRGKLYAINADVKTIVWCGPAAIAAATGLPVSTVNDAVRVATGRDIVRSMHLSQIAHVLGTLGYATNTTHLYRRDAQPTFKAFRTGRNQDQRARVLIVYITGHFVALLGNRLMDNRNRDPVMASDYRHQRVRVKGYVEVIGRRP